MSFTQGGHFWLSNPNEEPLLYSSLQWPQFVIRYVFMWLFVWCLSPTPDSKLQKVRDRSCFVHPELTSSRCSMHINKTVYAKPLAQNRCSVDIRNIIAWMNKLYLDPWIFNLILCSVLSQGLILWFRGICFGVPFLAILRKINPELFLPLVPQDI